MKNGFLIAVHHGLNNKMISHIYKSFNELFRNNNILQVNLKLEKTQIIKNTSSVGVEISKKRL